LTEIKSNLILIAYSKWCNESGICPKLILNLSVTNLFKQIDTTHLRVACYGRIQAKKLEQCINKNKNIKITGTLKK